MVKKILPFLFVAFLSQGFAGAQLSMTVPYGSFEQWDSHSGYSVTAYFIPISVYSSYSTPTGWDYLTYPVNETFSGITVNTNMPLIKSTQETGAVPDGSSAVKLQTFMLSDIVSSTVYNMAAGSLDESLTTEVFPSILSTGVVDIDHFMPVMTQMMSSMDDMGAILSILADMDIDYIITGGLPLNGFEPTRLTGSYKYQSAESGDNGGVLLLGTRYNTTLHKRELVGGGANIALTDCAAYAPFTVFYQSLHEFDASYAEQTPDSLIVMILSSASTNRQQGSYLCVDNLALWQDTCSSVVNLSAVPDIHEAALIWAVNDEVQGFELEYGTAGFVQGNGMVVTPTGTAHYLSGLAANTQYDVYIRTVCTNGIYGDWAQVSFTTLEDTCTSVLGLEVVSNPDNPTEYELTWTGSFEPQGWEVEYGLRDFELGTGTVVTVDEPALSLSSLPLLGNNWYDFYVRSLCTGNIYGDWAMAQHHTDRDTCARITSIEVDSANVSFTSDTLLTGYVATWESTFEPQGWNVEYGIEGDDTPLTPFFSTLNTVSLPPLLPDTLYMVRVRTVCNDSIHGDWESMVFRTRAYTVPDDTTGASIAAPLAPSRISIAPNPAHGQCVVDLDGIQEAVMRLYTSDGRLLYTATYCGSPATLQLPTSGVLILQVITPYGTLSRKIVSRPHDAVAD